MAKPAELMTKLTIEQLKQLLKAAVLKDEYYTNPKQKNNVINIIDRKLFGRTRDISLVNIIKKFNQAVEGDRNIRHYGGIDTEAVKSAFAQAMSSATGISAAAGYSAAVGQPVVDLKAVFQKTKRLALEIDQKITDSMVAGTQAYRSSMDGIIRNLTTGVWLGKPSTNSQPQPQTHTAVQVLNIDSFKAAKLMLEQKLNPLVLNMANKTSIGGGVEQGYKAQEESLFRCSNYFLALYPHGTRCTEGQHAGRYQYTHPISEFGSYYTPNVVVFREQRPDGHFQNIAPYFVSCIAVAGYDLGKLDSIEANLRDSQNVPLQGDELIAKFKELSKAKIRHLFEVALLHKHDSLVLGAMSCGAFALKDDKSGKTATAIANAYKEVLQEPAYANKFKRIIFAVMATSYDPKSKDNTNFRIFQNTLGEMNKASKPTPF